MQFCVESVQLPRIGGRALHCLTSEEVIILYTEAKDAEKDCHPNNFGITLGQELFPYEIIALFQLIKLHLGPWRR